MNKIALYWFDDANNIKQYTFDELSSLANKFSNYLLKINVIKGDRVFFFLPRVPEIYYGFIGALQMGAVGGNLFPAFQEKALLDRLKNSGAKILVTNKELASRVEPIRNQLPDLKNIILIEELPSLLDSQSEIFNPVEINPDDPAYMMYTSSTGNTPVCGIVTSHGALPQQIQTGKEVLDLKDNDIYWCTADPGWVTGTVYGIIVPWHLQITQIVYAGRFDAEKWFSILRDYKVTVWYTAPTAIRMLTGAEGKMINYDFSKIRHICSVGEALPPATLNWCQDHFHQPIHDTWWQTETGSIMIANLPNAKIKPGSMGKPVAGIKAAILDENHIEVGSDIEGDLAFEKGWPSMMIDVWGNRQQFERYFSGKWYLSGDRAKKDKDGYYWFIGRADDVIKTSGERVGPFEVESSLMECPQVAEAGVIGKPDPIRGQIIKAFVVLKPEINPTDELKIELQQYVKTHLAGHAYPREIEFIDKLPKNRSGKIVRRILKAKELGLPLGETSTLDND